MFWQLVGTWREKSFSSWNTSRGKEWMEKRWRSFPARSALLLRHAEFIWGVFKRLEQWRFFFLTKQWTDDLLIHIQRAICLMELWVPSSSSCEQTSSSKIDAFSFVVAVTGRPLPLRRSVDPVSLIFLSYELPCQNIQNSDAPSRFCMRSNLFIKIIFNDSLLFVG